MLSPGDAAGEPDRVSEGHLFEALLDAFVLVAEPFLEPQHAFADDRKAEVTGLDGARVHRSDRDFVHAVAFDRDEPVRIRLRRPACAGGDVPAQREDILRPGAVAQPGTRVRGSAIARERPRAAQVEDRPLHTVRAGETFRQVREARVVLRYAQLEAYQPFERDQQGTHAQACRAIGIVARPQCGQPAAAGGDILAGAQPLLRVHGRTPGRYAPR